MTISGLSLLAALAAGSAVWCALSGPPRLGRLRDHRSAGWQLAVERGLAGRPSAALRVGQRLLAGLGLGVGLGLGLSGWLSGWAWPIGLLVGFAVFAGLGWFEPGSVQRRRWLTVVQTPQVLDLLAAGLSAGLALRAATAAVITACPGPVAEDLSRVQHLIELGAGEVDAWRSLAGHPQLGVVAVDLARSVESGTRLVSALTAHAADARTARRSAIEVAARKVGVRSILPLMTCFIPAFLLLGVVPTVASALAKAFQAL